VKLVGLLSIYLTRKGRLANAKVSAIQPWYIGLNSLNHSSLAFFTVTPSTTNTLSPKNVKERNFPTKFELIAVQGHPRSSNPAVKGGLVM